MRIARRSLRSPADSEALGEMRVKGVAYIAIGTGLVGQRGGSRKEAANTHSGTAARTPEAN